MVRVRLFRKGKEKIFNYVSFEIAVKHIARIINHKTDLVVFEDIANNYITILFKQTMFQPVEWDSDTRRELFRIVTDDNED